MKSQQVLETWLTRPLHFEEWTSPLLSLPCRKETFKTIDSVSALLWKHGGQMFGGFVRDFYYPHLLLQMTREESLFYIPDDLVCIVLLYVFLPKMPAHTFHFKDLDVWFPDVEKAIDFVSDLVVDHLIVDQEDSISVGFDGTAYDISKALMTRISTFEKREKQEKQEKKDGLVNKRSKAIIRPKMSKANRTDHSPLSRFVLKVDIPNVLYYLKMDVLVTPFLPAMNYAVNLVTLGYDLTKQRWCTKVSLPYSLRDHSQYSTFTDTDNKTRVVCNSSLEDALWQSLTKETWRLPELTHYWFSGKNNDLASAQVAYLKEVSMMKRGWTFYDMSTGMNTVLNVVGMCEAKAPRSPDFSPMLF